MKWEVVRSIVMKENIVQKLTSKDDRSIYRKFCLLCAALICPNTKTVCVR